MIHISIQGLIEETRRDIVKNELILAVCKMPEEERNKFFYEATEKVKNLYVRLETLVEVTAVDNPVILRDGAPPIPAPESHTRVPTPPPVRDNTPEGWQEIVDGQVVTVPFTADEKASMGYK